MCVTCVVMKNDEWLDVNVEYYSAIEYCATQPTTTGTSSQHHVDIKIDVWK